MQDNSEKIKEIQFKKILYKLKEPYVLSFVTLDVYESLQVEMILQDGTSRIAEVVPLEGYTEESSSSIENYLQKKSVVLKGFSLTNARQLIESDIALQPFHTTALLTAIDLFNWIPKPEGVELDYVKAVSTDNYEKFTQDSMLVLNANKTLKIKLMGNVKNDIPALKFLENQTLPKNAIIRLDANQAYSLAQAEELFLFISNSSLIKYISYVEQPLAANDWDGHASLRRNFSKVSIMLDESIIVENDLIKASEIGIDFIKLKLFKQGGIRELLTLANIAKRQKIKVILGNGVATKISNHIEIQINQTFPELFYGASEANGYFKLV